MKQIDQIIKALNESGRAKCLKAFELHDKHGYDAKGVGWELTPTDFKGRTDFIGDRMINAGRYLSQYLVYEADGYYFEHQYSEDKCFRIETETTFGLDGQGNKVISHVTVTGYDLVFDLVQTMQDYVTVHFKSLNPNCIIVFDL